MLPRLLSAPLAMTIAAQSLTLPIQVLMDPQLPLASVPANLLVGPVVGFATMAGARRAVHILADAAMRIRLGLDCGMRHVRHGTRRRDGVGQRVRDHAVGRVAYRVHC